MTAEAMLEPPTRPRISTFMKRFRDLGLIELTTKRQLIIKEQRLMAYVMQLP